jgi:hypothetical protein
VRLDDDQPPHGGGGYGRGRRSTVGGIDANDTTQNAAIRTEALTKVYEPAGAPPDAGHAPPPAVDALDLEVGSHEVRDVHIEEPTLETVFINLTGRELRE